MLTIVQWTAPRPFFVECLKECTHGGSGLELNRLGTCTTSASVTTIGFMAIPELGGIMTTRFGLVEGLVHASTHARKSMIDTTKTVAARRRQLSRCSGCTLSSCSPRDAIATVGGGRGRFALTTLRGGGATTFTGGAATACCVVAFEPAM